MSKIDITDTDSDGLYDIYETAGMKIANGTVMYSFVSIADSDNDGLMDGEEITPRLDLNNMLCDDIYSFSQQDMYADTDAYNIVGLIEAKSIGEACLLYYDTGYKKRVTRFTNNWSKNRISDLVNIYTKTKYLGIERWPLLKYDFTEEQSKAARDSFVDYLLNRRNEE